MELQELLDVFGKGEGINDPKIYVEMRRFIAEKYCRSSIWNS